MDVVVEQGSGVRDQGSEVAHSHEHSHGEHGHHSHDDDVHAAQHEHSHEAHEHHDEHTHSHRSLSTILAIIEAATLSKTVKAQASRAFQLLGEAEAADSFDSH